MVSFIEVNNFAFSSYSKYVAAGLLDILSSRPNFSNDVKRFSQTHCNFSGRRQPSSALFPDFIIKVHRSPPVLIFGSLLMKNVGSISSISTATVSAKIKADIVSLLLSSVCLAYHRQMLFRWTSRNLLYHLHVNHKDLIHLTLYLKPIFEDFSHTHFTAHKIQMLYLLHSCLSVYNFMTIEHFTFREKLRCWQGGRAKKAFMWRLKLTELSCSSKTIKNHVGGQRACWKLCRVFGVKG